jgi:ribonuclease HI
VGALESLKEFWRCNSSDPTQVADQETPPITKNLKWQAPPEGTIKVNWDASINGKKSCIGLGVVARDCKSDVLAAKCVQKNFFVDPKTAEAMAALWAVLFCKECGFLDVIFEGDASQVVNEIHSKPPFLSTTSHLIGSISQEIQGLRSATFVHVHRECNGAAHLLAKEAAIHEEEMCWIEDTPYFLDTVILRERV